MESKQKWYNSYKLGYLLILLPPLGLYGVYKNETLPLKWKLATCAALAIAIISGIVIYSI